MDASVALAGVTSVLRRTTAAKALYLAWSTTALRRPAAPPAAGASLFFGNLATTVLALRRAFHIALRRSTRTHGNRPWHSFEYIDVS